MNMIPLVKAIEPGRAQHVNRKPSFRIVVLRSITSVVVGVSLVGKQHHRG